MTSATWLTRGGWALAAGFMVGGLSALAIPTGSSPSTPSTTTTTTTIAAPSTSAATLPAPTTVPTTSAPPTTACPGPGDVAKPKAGPGRGREDRCAPAPPDAGRGDRRR